MTTVQSRFDLDAVLDGVSESVQDPTASPITLGGTLQGSYDTLVDHLGLASSDSQTVKYLLVHDGRFEIGLGELTEGSPDTLSRDLILESTEGGEPLEDFTGTSSAKVGLFRETGPEGGKVLESFTDVFGVHIADGRTNIEDLGSHYQYSPERYRLLRDGSREFPEYGSVSGFTDEADHFALSPAQGETLVLETTDRPRYVVETEIVRTLAVRLSRSLESGDLARMGAFDGTDGWFFEKTPSHGARGIDLVTFRNGSQAKRASGTLGKDLTTVQTRLGLSGPWYDIGRILWHQSFSNAGFQRNPVVGRSSIDDARGPQTGNLPMRFEITRGASASAITMECGSIGAHTLGSIDPQTRLKQFSKTINIGTTGAWVPLFAIRLAPDRTIVNAQLIACQAIKWDANGDVEVTARSFAPENIHESDDTQLDDADFDPPAVLATQNSALETSEAVTQVVESDGSTFSASMSNPGGYQIGYDRLTSSNKATASFRAPNVRQQIPPQDIIVVMGKCSSTGNVTTAIGVEEDW